MWRIPRNAVSLRYHHPSLGCLMHKVPKTRNLIQFRQIVQLSNNKAKQFQLLQQQQQQQLKSNTIARLLLNIPSKRFNSTNTKEQESSTHTDGSNDKFELSDLKRLARLAKRDWKLLLTAISLLSVSCLIGMSLPKIIGIVLDELKQIMSNPDFTVDDVPEIAFGLNLYEFISLVGVSLLVGTAANYGRVILLRVLSERVVARLRANVIKKTMHQDAEFFDNNKVGDLISRLSSDAYVVSRSLTQKVSDGFKAMLCGSVGIGMMISISPQLSAFLLFLTPPVMLSASYFGRLIRNNSRDLQEATGSLTKVAEEQFSGIKTVQSFVAEQKEIKRYNHAIRHIFNVGKQSAFINAKFFSLTAVLGDMSFLVVLAYGSYLVLHGSLSIGDLTAYMMYTEYTGSSIFGLSTFYSEIMQGAGAASRLFELTDRIPSISPTLGKKFVPNKGEIEFKNVSFSYPTRASNQIFKNLSFKIDAGSNVCIVGPSGRGKSTIASLLLRYYNPTTGQIFVDGQDISKVSSKSLRRHMSIVQQEPVLMSGTIRDNITYGLVEKPTQDEVRSITKKCFCHNFITKFPNSYDTILGPHGTLLSGGQKQRIAIARALIKKPTILILDEATSALDVESEGAINYTFGKLMKSKSITIISIAHRLSTIRRSENVIVLGNDGSVAEVGKFKELYADPGSELSKLLHEKATRSERQQNTAEDQEIDPEETINIENSTPESDITQELLENPIKEAIMDVAADNKPITPRK
ncbi:hypothetical protein Kpol_1045p83 [Vanderwaltozyma polyspora DSM 70294]|uniref:ATP-dependent permease MDL2, mitochondrial n=1 Tax=Vanderwaltozyma polyspora (strain ATCC 22028 / DSM 70294 / BCRC 21397 / CBS 2163 / NBRC 10782 / NRRL Y-8283 / UCD 57-17) TaxID=436907 RepID=A7TI89_VANPO|nr:uncharacterized protein Kpol_1045p83 [Vanderwaltozyma polyspora DSM 70294]EDO18096.1 hypothetical protein Kpol_1045p83 [Vanderwaltozyma polyspora DSM 70294]